MEEEQELKKNLWNLLSGKITFKEYVLGRLRWFMSWENLKSFILYFFMLSLGLVLYQTAAKNYDNHQECLLGHQLMTKQITCYNSSYGTGLNISQLSNNASNSSSIPQETHQSAASP